MKKLLALVLLSGLLVSCDTRVGHPYVDDATIIDIQFIGAHEERHCGKGCSYHPVDDRWYLDVCSNINHNCDVIRLDHPPFEWEKLNKHVKAEWQKYSNGRIDLRGIHAGDIST